METSQQSKPELSLLEALLEKTAEAYGFTAQDLRGESHERQQVNARRYFCWRANELGFSSPQIGRVLHRHHTSVLHLLGRLAGKGEGTRPKEPMPS